MVGLCFVSDKTVKLGSAKLWVGAIDLRNSASGCRRRDEEERSGNEARNNYREMKNAVADQ